MRLRQTIARMRAYGPPTALSTSQSAAPLRGEAGCLPESPRGRREAASRLGTGFPKTSTASGRARNGGQHHGLPLTARTTTRLLMKRAQEKAGKHSTELGKGGTLFPRTPRQGTGSRPEARVLRRMQPSTAPAEERVRWAAPEREGVTTKNACSVQDAPRAGPPVRLRPRNNHSNARAPPLARLGFRMPGTQDLIMLHHRDLKDGKSVKNRKTRLKPGSNASLSTQDARRAEALLQLLLQPFKQQLGLLKCFIICSMSLFIRLCGSAVISASCTVPAMACG